MSAVATATETRANGRTVDVAKSMAVAASLNTQEEILRAMGEGLVTVQDASKRLDEIKAASPAANPPRRTFPDLRRTRKNTNRVWMAFGKGVKGEVWCCTLNREAALAMVKAAKDGALDVILKDHANIPLSADHSED